MASRNFVGMAALHRGLVAIAGSFAPNGSSAISASSRKGLGWSVAYTSTGLYTVTFSDKFVDLVSVTATLQLAAADDQAIQIGTWTAASKALQIRVIQSSNSTPTVQDVTADANNRINFIAIFSNSSVVPTRG